MPGSDFEECILLGLYCHGILAWLYTLADVKTHSKKQTFVQFYRWGTTDDSFNHKPDSAHATALPLTSVINGRPVFLSVQRCCSAEVLRVLFSHFVDICIDPAHLTEEKIVLVQYFPNKMTGLLFLIQSGVCGKLTWARFQRRSKTTTAQQKRFHPMSNQLSLPWRGGDPTRGQKPLPLWCLSNTMMNWALLVSINLSLQCCFINPIIRVYLWYETHADLRVLKKI